MLNTLYNALIKPRSLNKDSQNRELVLNYILLGLITLTGLEFLGELFGFVLLRQHYLLYRLAGTLSVWLVSIGILWLARTRQLQRPAAYFIVGCFLAITTAVVAQWGNLTPTGILLFSLVIVMAGILLGARHSLYMALASSLVLAILEYLKTTGQLKPNLAWMQRPSSPSDIFGFGIIYIIIALVSWLFNRQMEQSLHRARASEAALVKHNESLEATVKKRTRQLEAEQLEKVQQVYRFAEMGRISSALFHDLANHLSSVSLDIEGLNNTKQSQIMRRIQTDISYIDDVVQRVRLQLRGQGSVERFNVGKEVTKVSGILHYKLVQSGIKLKIDLPDQAIYWRGDIIPFRQIISNLLTNAVESYDKSQVKKRLINIELSSSNKLICICVTDWGMGIPDSKLAKVFDPFYSSKIDGTGIGLYLVKQIVERDLHGTIQLTSDRKNGTIFTINLPQQDGTK